MTFPKKILKLPKDLKQNANENQTLLNEVDVTVSEFEVISFFSLNRV
jgi:hypothetical protein